MDVKFMVTGLLFFVTEIEVLSYPSGLLHVQSLPEGKSKVLASKNKKQCSVDELSPSFSLSLLDSFMIYLHYLTYHTLLCRIAPTIDPEVLSNMRMSQFVGHAPKPTHLRRNQVPYDLERDWSDSVPESPMMRGKEAL